MSNLLNSILIFGCIVATTSCSVATTNVMPDVMWSIIIIQALIIIALLLYIRRQRYTNHDHANNVNVMDCKAENSQHVSQETDFALEPVESGTTTDDTSESGENEVDDEYQRFINIENDIISRRLYASNLNREQLIKELGIPRAQFASLFRNHAGESYSKYMNRLRMREAVRMMQNSPNSTIDTIVAECGMSRQLFYVMFKEQYGVTPTEYRAHHSTM